jgi:tetratricopeptide (TPR) repeat protein
MQMIEGALTLQAAIKRAAVFYMRGQLDEAKRLARAIIEVRADCFDAFHLIAVIEARRRRYVEALASYDRALALRPEHADMLNHRGLILQELKRFDAALASYDRALAARPEHADTLNNRGNALKALKRFDEALASYDRALAVRPDFIEAFYNRGNTLKELKRFVAALASYDRALVLRPDYAEALNNRGAILRELKRFDEALASYDRALAVRPENADALYNRGNTLKELKRFDAALASYDRALAARPDYTEALNNRGAILRELKRFDEALASYDRSLAVRPDYAEALNNRAITLQALKHFDQALASCDRALAVRPDYAEALYNRGIILQELKRFDEALVSYDRALDVRPDYTEALDNRGAILRELKRFDEALASYDRALAVQPEHADTLNNRGNTLKALKRFDAALTSYDRALAVRPDYAEAHWNESLVRLLTGDFVRGWKKFEWRWKNESLNRSWRNFAQPLWLGETGIEGKTILLHCEQGLGDTIQFCRYVPLVAARGARVLLQVPEALQGLMASVAGVAQVIGATSMLPDFDLHCPLLSLPLAFDTRLDTIPSATPYLSASPESVSSWNVTLGLKHRPRIGLVWSGNPVHTNDHNRSIKLKILLQLLDIDATFVSLQKDIHADDATVLKDRSDLLNFGDKLADFSETAALVSNLDLVISVDTSLAHLAGALAKPVWVLLPFLSDWRWLLDRDDSPWYPTARLFRQRAADDWSGVVGDVGIELRSDYPLSASSVQHAHAWQPALDGHQSTPNSYYCT